MGARRLHPEGARGRGRRRRSGLRLTPVLLVSLATLLIIARSAAAADISGSGIGLPWAAGESATLLAGPHHNLSHDCDGSPACNSIDFVPASGIVRAAAAGTVHFPYCGPHHRLVVIDHGNGWVTGYYHLPDPRSFVHEGEHVAAGAPLGHVGNDLSCGGTPREGHPHVHFFVKHVAGGYKNLGDPFRTTKWDVDLRGAVLGGWRVTGTLAGACMTFGIHRACAEAGQVKNFGAGHGGKTPAQRCSKPPLGYDSFNVRRTTCPFARRVLAGARHGKHPFGFSCRVISRAPGGQGFPADEVCRRGRAVVTGRLRDGP